MVGRNGDPNTEAVWVHLAVVVRKTTCKREELLRVRFMWDVGQDLLEQRVVQREGVAKLVHQRKFVEEAVAVTIRCKKKYFIYFVAASQATLHYH